MACRRDHERQAWLERMAAPNLVVHTPAARNVINLGDPQVEPSGAEWSKDALQLLWLKLLELLHPGETVAQAMLRLCREDGCCCNGQHCKRQNGSPGSSTGVNAELSSARGSRFTALVACMQELTEAGYAFVFRQTREQLWLGHARRTTAVDDAQLSLDLLGQMLPSSPHEPNPQAAKIADARPGVDLNTPSMAAYSYLPGGEHGGEQQMAASAGCSAGMPGLLEPPAASQNAGEFGTVEPVMQALGAGTTSRLCRGGDSAVVSQATDGEDVEDSAVSTGLLIPHHIEATASGPSSPTSLGGAGLLWGSVSIDMFDIPVVEQGQRSQADMQVSMATASASRGGGARMAEVLMKERWDLGVGGEPMDDMEEWVEEVSIDKNGISAAEGVNEMPEQGGAVEATDIAYLFDQEETVAESFQTGAAAGQTAAVGAVQSDTLQGQVQLALAQRGFHELHPGSVLLYNHDLNFFYDQGTQLFGDPALGVWYRCNANGLEVASIMDRGQRPSPTDTCCSSFFAHQAAAPPPPPPPPPE